MEDVRLQRLRTALTEKINEFLAEAVPDDWEGLDTSIGDRTAELMADSAFNILLAQSGLTIHSLTSSVKVLDDSDNFFDED